MFSTLLPFSSKDASSAKCRVLKRRQVNTDTSIRSLMQDARGSHFVNTLKHVSAHGNPGTESPWDVPLVTEFARHFGCSRCVSSTPARLSWAGPRGRRCSLPGAPQLLSVCAGEETITRLSGGTSAPGALPPSLPLLTEPGTSGPSPSLVLLPGLHKDFSVCPLMPGLSPPPRVAPGPSVPACAARSPEWSLCPWTGRGVAEAHK